VNAYDVLGPERQDPPIDLKARARLKPVPELAALERMEGRGIGS
jgi:hypothetical protein